MIRFFPSENGIICYERYDERANLLALCNFTEETKAIKLPDTHSDGSVLIANEDTMRPEGKQLLLPAYGAIALFGKRSNM